MTQDAPNKNPQDLTWSKVFSDPDPSPTVSVDTTLGEQAGLQAAEAITGEYWAVDELQERPDAAVCNNSVSAGAYKTAGESLVNATGEADVLALGGARVYASGRARIAAGQNASVVATEHAKVTAKGNAAVCATGSAKVYASDDVIVVALDRTEVYASGRVHIKAFGSSTVYASADSVVEVDYPTGCTIYLYGNARQVAIKPSEK